MNLLVDLKDVHLLPADEVGFKARCLSVLMKSNIPVPPGVVIRSNAFREFLRGKGIEEYLFSAIDRIRKGGRERDLRGGYEDLKARFLEAGLPPPLRKEIGRFLAGRRKEIPLMVRSSGYGEGSLQHSLAGIYESIPNLLGGGGVERGVLLCWASLFSPRALIMEEGAALSIEDVRMGVILQDMVRPRASGIIFTASPLSGRGGEMVIEATTGHGIPLMQGVLTPDRFTLVKRRPFRKHPLAIKEAVGGAKEVVGVIREPGDGKIEVERSERAGKESLSLREDEVMALGEMGLSIENIFRKPQDIEWVISEEDGRIYIVQSRPVAPAERGARHYIRKKGHILWSCRFSGERWPSLATPLGWSITGDILESFIYFPETQGRFFGGSRAITLFRNLPYFNITIFRHLIFKLPLLGTPFFMLEFLPPEEVFEIKNSGNFPPDLSLIAHILGEVVKGNLWKRYSFNFLTNHKEWESFVPIFVEAIENMDFDPSSLEAVIGEIERGRRWMVKYIRIHLLSLLFANLFFQLLGGLIIKFLGEERKDLLVPLTSGSPENKVLIINEELVSLSRFLREHPGLEKSLLKRLEAAGATWVGIERDLSATEDGRVFLQSMKRFLHIYGHRSEATWEVSSVKWGEDPLKPLSVIARYLKGDIRDGKGLGSKDAGDFLSSLREANRLLEGLPFEKRFPIRRLFFLAALKYCRRYILLRENQRFYLDRLYFGMKKVLKKAEKILSGKGVIERDGDVFYLTLKEIREISEGVLGGREAGEIVSKRREEEAIFKNLPHPPFLRGSPPEPIEEGEESRVIQGLPVSPGVASGRVRKVRGYDDLLEAGRGDIIVSRGMDPAWSHLLILSSGFIMEMGGLLSHAAVVAREYGIPGVANISGAFDIFRHGQPVRVDGTRGLVFL